ncbi:MAG TPA: patatin-like phospholipase family protein [Longimicrobiales bacterium]
MQRVILVLGGGGVKGMAHIGAWKAIEEAGLEVKEIVGTSIGALVGACIAGGMGWRELAPLAVALRKRDIVSMNGRSVLLNGIRQRSIFHGERLADYIRSILPVERFEDLALPLSLNAVDLETGQTEWFGAGGRTDVSLAEAVHASCALPMFYPPVEIGGRHYVDGGVGAALAVERARDRGAELVVAVDVSAGPVKDSLDTISKGMVAIHHRVYDIMSHAQREAVLEGWSGPPLIYVRPRLDGISTFDFTRTHYFLEEGYRAARSAIGEWKKSAVAAD